MEQLASPAIEERSNESSSNKPGNVAVSVELPADLGNLCLSSAFDRKEKAKELGDLLKSALCLAVKKKKDEMDNLAGSDLCQSCLITIDNTINKQIGTKNTNLFAVEPSAEFFDDVCKRSQFSSASDKIKEKRLGNELLQAINVAIKNEKNKTDILWDMKYASGFGKSDLLNIRRILDQFEAEHIHPFAYFYRKTIVHKVSSYCSADEFHRLVKLMILMGKERLFCVHNSIEANTAVHVAIKNVINLHPETIDLLAENCGADFTMRNKCGNNVLHLASRKASLATLQRIVHYYNGDLNTPNIAGNTVLHLAAGKGNPDILQYLVSLNGMKVNAKNNHGTTALHSLFRAPADNFIKNLNILVGAGADINAVDLNGRNILFYAAFHGWSVEATQEIIKLGGDCSKKDKKGRSILHVCEKNNNVYLLKYFMRFGINVNDKEKDLGRTALHTAAAENNLKAFEHLLSSGGDVNLKDVHGDTPLSLILNAQTEDSDSSLEVIQMLIKQQVKLDGKNNSIENLLMLAAEKRMTRADRQRIVDLVVDLNAEYDDGRSLLHSLAIDGNMELAMYLISKGANVSKKDFKGRTPLHLSVASNSSMNRRCGKFLNKLLKHGADINATDNLGLNVLLLAAKSGKEWKDLDRLVKLGASWDVTDKKGNSILHILTKEGSVHALEKFLSLGADVNAVNDCKETPLHILQYAKRNFIETATVLMVNRAQRDAVDSFGQNALHASFVAKRSIKELVFLHSFYQMSEVGVGTSDQVME